MSGKNILIDFINVVFTLILITFCIFYFTVGNRFQNFTEIMKALVPLAFFGILFLVKLKLSRLHLEKRKQEDNLYITLNLTYFDKIKSNLIVFSLPIIVCMVPFIINRTVDLISILQACVVFIITYVWQEAIFKKEN